jgi:hypothetical protein
MPLNALWGKNGICVRACQASRACGKFTGSKEKTGNLGDRVMRSCAMCWHLADRSAASLQKETRRGFPRRVSDAIERDAYQDSAAAAARPATLPQKVQSPTAVPLT